MGLKKMIEDIKILNTDLGTIMDFIIKVVCPCLLFIAIFVFGVAFFQRYQATKIKSIKRKTKGSAHGVIFGNKGLFNYYSPCDDEGSIGVFSGSGTGKTTAIVIPTIRSWVGTVFCIDISGDISRNCNVENKLLYEPKNQKSNPYNIFAVIDILENDEDKIRELQKLALLVMPPVNGMTENAKFYYDNGRKILSASLIAFYFKGFDFCDICKKIYDNGYKTLFKEIDETENETAINLINSFLEIPEQWTASSKESCDNSILLFATEPTVFRTLRRPQNNEIAITNETIEKYNIFIRIEDEDMEFYAPLINIITSQQMQYISRRQVDNDSPQILLVLDEFASLGLENVMVLNALRKYRKRKCRTLILSQNLADLDILYGHETTRALLSNMKFKVLLGGLGEPESQKYFADLIGFEDVTKHSTSSNSQDTTETTSEGRQYKIEPSELDKQGKDTAIVIVSEGVGFIKLNKNYFFKAK